MVQHGLVSMAIAEGEPYRNRYQPASRRGGHARPYIRGERGMIGRAWRILRRQPSAVIVTLPFAALLVFVAALALRALPFRWIAPILGRNLGSVPRVPLSSTRQQRIAYHTGLAVELAAHIVPVRSDCLRQALAAAVIFRLRRIPYAALLGAAVDLPEARNRLSAHAWIQSGPIVATGGRGGFQTYGVVACFMPAHWLGIRSRTRQYPTCGTTTRRHLRAEPTLGLVDGEPAAALSPQPDPRD